MLPDDLPNTRTFAGVPVIIDPWMPVDEVWLMEKGKRVTIHVHEGPRGHEDVEVWLRRAKVIKRIMLDETAEETEKWRVPFPIKKVFDL